MTDEERIEECRKEIRRLHGVIRGYQETNNHGHTTAQLLEIIELWVRQLRKKDKYPLVLLDDLQHNMEFILQENGVECTYCDSDLENLWDELTDIPIDENECLDVEWNGWDKGTHREEIWHWFDERHSRGVAWLMYEYEGRK